MTSSLPSFAPRAAQQRLDVLRSMPRWRAQLGGWSGVALACALLSACGGQEGGGGAPAAPAAAQLPQVGVVVLQPQSQQLEATLPGRTSAYQSAQVRPQVSGIIQERLFTEGAMVKKGQVLYRLDASTLKAAAASAAAVLAKTEATLQTQKANAARNAELVKIHAISQQAFEESQAAVKQAQADVQVAKANLEAASINLKYASIEAPISGRISLSQVTPGALVTANQANALTEIVQMDPMYVDFTQSTAELLQLKNDWAAGRYQKVAGEQLPLRIELEDGSAYPHEAQLQFSGLIVNSTMGTVTLRARVPNPDGVLLPGMFVQAHLPTGLAPEAMLVPQRAISRDLTGRASVFVLKDGDVVEKRYVELGRALGAHWLLDSGLNAGERVVVDGFQRIKPGDKVKAVEVAADAKSGSKPVDPQAAAASLRAAAQPAK